jgi:hypothetical protein
VSSSSSTPAPPSGLEKWTQNALNECDENYCVTQGSEPTYNERVTAPASHVASLKFAHPALAARIQGAENEKLIPFFATLAMGQLAGLEVGALEADVAPEVEMGESLGAPRAAPMSTAPPRSVSIGTHTPSEMQIVRIIEHGERIADIVDEVEELTITTYNEHAVVKLNTGERAIVSGRPTSIDFPPEVTRVFGHSHPYQFSAAGPSEMDYGSLPSFGQRSSYLLEQGELYRFSFSGGPQRSLFQRGTQ